MGHQVSKNVRYLLWRMQVPRERWFSWLLANTSVGDTFSRALVQGSLADDQTKPDELRELARALGQEDEGETLRFADLPHEGANVLVENLKFLFDSLGYGGKRSLAADLGIDPTTVSRWLNGSYVPQGPSLRQLVSRFGLPPETNLREDPVFLSIEPVSTIDQRRWVQSRVEALSLAEFRELYPALRRMLEER